ncbi:hypothetical protein [Aeoliella sp. SH292]|uniref:hypothetical protein n=1 Tax=Aeoliella sp. SH292 TaxID=3454464 RepID=UPI003F9D1BBC
MIRPLRRPVSSLCFGVLAVAVVTLTVAGGISPARGALLNPLAHTSLGDFEVGIGNAVTIDTNTAELRVNGILAFTGVINNQAGAADPLSGAPELAVFSFDNILIGPGVAVTVTGDRGLSLLSRGDVTIRSPLSVSGGNYAAPGQAGGYAGAAIGNGTGPGAGKATTIGNYAGAGGGGYGGAGGNGEGYNPTDSAGGAAYPVTNTLSGTLFGGSGGAAGINGGTYGAGGSGGGVLEISALGNVDLRSAISSNGGLAGVGANNFGGGGGGSGGSIRIAGATVNLGPSGAVAANGGAGGGTGSLAGGGGSGGRILVQQSGGPLASGVTANGGVAYGVAAAGSSGTVEQLGTQLDATAVELNVRLGTGSASGQAALSRDGDMNGSLFGYFDHVGTGFTGASEGQTFAFTGPLGGGLVELLPLTYSTSTRGTENITVRSNGGDAVLAVGRGVGPTFATNMGTHPNTTINLGTTDVGHSAAFHLIVNNASTDLGYDSSLTALGVLDISISGPGADAFAVDNLIPSVLFEQQYANLPIHFNPTEAREYSALLTITTDQGAGNGMFGQTFSYQLYGGGLSTSTVPEPSSMVVLTIACIVGMLAVSNRKSRIG